MKHKRSLISIAMAIVVLVSLCAVYASTSVSAADESSANVQGSLVGAPAGIVGTPAVCSPGKGSFDLFVRGTDNALWWRHAYMGSWGQWVNLGGRGTSDPSAASYASGGLFVCVRGTDGACWYITSTDKGSTWNAWNTLGGKLLEGTGPAAFSYGGGVLMAVIGMNHELYRWAPGWKSLGGYLTSSPGATSPATNVLTIAARGRDGALWRASTSNNFASWSWTSLGGQLFAGTGPTVVYDGVNIRHAVTGTNHQLYWWNDGWKSLSGYLTSSPVAASEATNKVDVFVRGGDGDLWSTVTYNGGASWVPWWKIAG